MSDNRTILIVDDDPDIRQLVAMTLDDAGFAVKQAENGRRGLQLLTGFTPSLILLDMMMPEMNGLEFCQQLLKHNVTHIPVLVVSAVNERAKFLQQFHELPLEKKGFLNKPFQNDELVARVRELLGDAPAAAAPAPPPPAPTPSGARPARPAPSGPRLRLLFIDDDEDLRILMRAMLDDGFEVGVAENGMEALEMIDAFQPDLCVCDIGMPVLDGFGTIAAIRRHPGYFELPVIFLSGEEKPGIARKSIEAGANLFIPKPIDPSRLAAVLHRFAAEAEMEPTARRPVPAKAPTPPPRPAAAATPEPTSAPSRPIRILTIDSNVENMAEIKELLRKDKHGRWETLWSEEPHAALSKLVTWEPDLILYNPRQKVMDGTMFVQTLQLKKFLDRHIVAFVGKEFLDGDVEYSRHKLGREPIRLDRPEAHIAGQIMEAVMAARAKWAPKRYTVEQARQMERQGEMIEAADADKLRRQREFLREKFKKMQAEIDGAAKNK